MNFRSLQFRITKWFVGFLALALLCVWVGVYLSVQQFLITSQKRNLNNAVHNIESQFLSEYDAKGEAWVADEMGDVYAGGADRYVRVLHNGREIFHSHDMRNPPIAVSEIPLPREDEAGLLHIQHGDGRLLESVDHYTSANGEKFTIVVGASEAAARRVLRSLAIVLSIVCPLVL